MSVEPSVSAFLRNTQNTHTPAVLASAARMILVLRTFTDGKVEEMSPQECTWLSETLETFLQYSEEEQVKSMEEQASRSSAPPLFSKGMMGIMNFLQILFTLRNEPRYQNWRRVVICIKGLIEHGGQDEWTKNSVYHKDGSVSVVDASLQEVLNLVCFATLEERQSPEDKQDRIDSLFQCLLNSKWKENNICFGGIQHGLLFLLNGWNGVFFIEDTLAFLIDTTRVFLNEKLREAIPDLSPRQVFLFGWLRGPTSEVSEWLTAQSGALQPVLVEACQKYGLDPQDKKINDLIESLLSLSPALDDFREAICIGNILNLQTFSKARNFLGASSDARNATLGRIQEEIARATHPTPVLLQACQSFMVLEEALQLLVKHASRLMFVELESDRWRQAVDSAADTSFGLGDASKALRESLQLAFERFPEVDLETIRPLIALVNAQLLEFEQRFKTDLIENFFVQTDEAQEVQLNYLYEHQEQYILTDATLAHWIAENSEPDEAAVVALSPYEINRILLHALLEKRERWTEIFRSALKMVLAWFKRDDLNPREKSFRAAYPLSFLFSFDMLEVYAFPDIEWDFITLAQKVYVGELGTEVLRDMLNTHGDLPEAVFPQLKYYLQHHEQFENQKQLLLLSWCGLAAEQKDPELYVLAQSRLNQQIMTALDLMKVFRHKATSTQVERIFDAVQNRWNVLITNIDDLMTVLYGDELTPKRAASILNAIQDRWVQLMTNGRALAEVFRSCCLELNQKVEIFNFFAKQHPRTNSQIKDAYNLLIGKRSYWCLREEEVVNIYEALLPPPSVLPKSLLRVSEQPSRFRYDEDQRDEDKCSASGSSSAPSSGAK